MLARRTRSFIALSFLASAVLRPHSARAVQVTQAAESPAAPTDTRRRMGPAAPADTLRQMGPAAPADTLRRVGPAAPAHSLLPVWLGAPADTVRHQRRAPRNPRGVTAPIDMGVERKLGSASLEDAVRIRRAVILGALPVFGPTQGSLRLPDGGGPIRLSETGDESVRATDETLIGSAAR